MSDLHVIAADKNRHDLCVVHDASLTLDLGDGTDSFELRMPVAGAPRGLTSGGLVYIDGTEYGGIVGDVGSDTTERVHRAVYEGRTWSGVLEDKVLRPDQGKDYLTVSGEAHAVMLQLINRLALADLFSVNARDSGFNVNYRFARYVTGCTGIRSMLATVGARPTMIWDNGKIVISAVPIIDHSTHEREAAKTGMRLKQARRRINHLICLGMGDLRNRTVIDLYADAAGSVSRTQTLFGINERIEVYDYGSAEDDELLQAGIQRLEEKQDADECDVSGIPAGSYGIGDIIGGRDSRLGVYVSARIERIAVDIGRRGAQVSYEAGNPSVRVTQRF